MSRREFLGTLAASALLAACVPATQKTSTAQPAKATPTITPEPKRNPRIALALGGGAARGFAHIGVLKALETSGITPDLIVGTSAGSVVGALYASGFTAFELQKITFQMDETTFTNWAVLERGLLKSDAIERFVNEQLKNKPMESLKRKFAAVATDLSAGKPAIFTTGNVGLAVRASSSVPGVFAPVQIRGKEYVDGGLTSPIPVRPARQLGADIVIAVDISERPSGKPNQNTMSTLLDTISIMGTTIGQYELAEADVVIQPNIKGLPSASFQQKNEAILRGEEAGYAAIAAVKQKIAAFRGEARTS